MRIATQRDMKPAPPRFDPQREQQRLAAMLGAAFDPDYYWRRDTVVGTPLGDVDRPAAFPTIHSLQAPEGNR